MCPWADLGTLVYIREYHIKVLLDSCGLLYRGTLVPQGVSYEYIRLSTACIYVVGAAEAFVSCRGIWGKFERFAVDNANTSDL